MDRAAVFVDAGYLFAQGSTLIAGVKLPRSETRLDQEKALAFLDALSGKLTGLPLLRIYWYDGTDSGPTAVHTTLAFRPRVKIRLGIVNVHGQQKGVDSLIVSDLINLSRNRAMSDVVLMTGDEDIRVGVQQAQELGVAVHLVGLEPIARNQSNLLRQEADTVHEVSKAEVATFLSRAPVASAPPMPTSVVPSVVPSSSSATPSEAALTALAQQLAGSIPKADSDRVAQDPNGIVPAELDRQLLFSAASAQGPGSPRLSEHEKRLLRAAFIRSCKARG